MAANRLFLVVKQDTILQSSGYLVRAHDEDDARNLVDAGMYIEETSVQTLDTLESETVSVTEIDTEAKGQERNSHETRTDRRQIDLPNIG